jgi:two-component system nitrogen regulation sensor histidine kinase GlnL
MSAETSKRLFEAYYTTKATGQGFGLAIAAKIIDDHGGVIEVSESKRGKTLIDIYLPIARDGEEP